MAVTSLLHTLFRRRKKSTEFMNIFEFDFDTIRTATNEFSDLVGRGGFGSVYKGRLQSGQEIAVKVLFKSSIRTQTQFHDELTLLSKLRHKNLINLLGFATKRDDHCLVYEFMPNSSLDRFIQDPYRASQLLLSWETFRSIIDGIACGLRYLHEESGLYIVHRDIKPQNILLDKDLKPKITGFELAMMMEQGENEGETTGIAGTLGYLDPEYVRTGRVSVKSDVFAFGITILTIVSRRQPWRRDGNSLIEYVMRCWNRGESIEVIHEVIREEESEDSVSEILRYIHIAMLCIDENAETRPSIDKVLHWLSCFSTPLPEPNIGHRFLAEEETARSWSPSLSPGHSSVSSPISSR